MRMENFSRVAQLVQERLEIQVALDAPEPCRGIIGIDARWPFLLASRIVEQVLPYVIEALRARLKEIDAELIELGMSID
ncbi:MAG: hypothetical protein ACOY7L_18305 [Pseudomonadota bacterium]